MSIKLKLEGFDELIKQIEKAGGNVNDIADKCIKKSADIMDAELRDEMRKANVKTSLIDAMPPPQIESSGNRYSARVGYKKGNYNPKNPSDGYKVVFLNYGTPNRTMHGKIQEGGKIKLGFIKRAKRKAKTKIKKQQEETLKDILKEL